MHFIEGIYVSITHERNDSWRDISSKYFCYSKVRLTRKYDGAIHTTIVAVSTNKGTKRIRISHDCNNDLVHPRIPYGL